MNRVALYTLLILIYLGLSLSFSPRDAGTIFIRNERVYNSIFKGAPIEVVLVNYFQAGFLIKTYYHRYKVIYGFKRPRQFTTRVSKKFYEKNIPNIGMSLFRRAEQEDIHNTVPMPPGTLFIGDHAYGNWIFANSGDKIWKFHRAYKLFPRLFYWDDFVPNYNFYEKSKTYQKENQPFYGLRKEFGSNGQLTKKMFNNFFKSERITDQPLNRIFDKYISLKPYWENHE